MPISTFNSSSFYFMCFVPLLLHAHIFRILCFLLYSFLYNFEMSLFLVLLFVLKYIGCGIPWWLSRLRIWCWQCYGLVTAVAWVWFLAQELSHAMDMAKGKKKNLYLKRNILADINTVTPAFLYLFSVKGNYPNSSHCHYWKIYLFWWWKLKNQTGI